MVDYRAPIRDLQFVLHEMLQLSSYQDTTGFEDASEDLINAILEEAGKFTSETLAPLNETGDKQGCILENGVVRTPDGFKEAYQQMVDNGWPAIGAHKQYGGQEMPHVISLTVNEMVSSSNMAFGMYPGLTQGAYAALYTGGTDTQKDLYLPKMASGEWTGTMNLTEPHCGTDLGLLRTKAVPQADGSYKLTGQKIFISAGEHDLSDNIIHLVLARIEGAPEGVKGISLFIVPKFLPKEDGTPGPRNGVSCGKLEEKMGIHGNATCVMNFDEATGFLLGEEHQGLKIMFIMMNEARIGVGQQGLALAEAAYQEGLSYAKDRLQGRSITGAKNPEGPADPIIVHPDVRRMLMNAKAFIEGSRGFMLWLALQGDLSHKSPDEEIREKADDYLSLLTPVLKGYLTDKGFDITVDMQQIFGGHGYTEEWGMSQFVRDARIAMIYEGANGIQALDLVGRKLAQNGGRAIMNFIAELKGFAEDNKGDESLKAYINGVETGVTQLEEATMWLMENGLKNFDNAGAASTDYMHLLGIVTLAYIWAQQAEIATSKLKEGAGDEETFYKTKLATADYFMARILPDTSSHLAKIKTGAETVMALADSAF